MVNIPENWTRIEGTVRLARAAKEKPEHLDLEVSVTSAAPVEGFREALSNPIGADIVVRVPSDICQRLGVEAGTMIRTRVRRGRTPNLTFAHTREFEVSRPKE